MRERLLRKIKQNKAFTLMEMMIAVAIVIILLGISIVSIIDWTKTLKMTELDNYAKNVYLEAQNQLASLETEGSLSKLYNNLVLEDGLYYDEYNERKLAQAPTDYDISLYGSYYERMYYFINDDGIMTTFIPAVSLSDENGGYLIELNPESGDVYGVFYWEKGNEYIGTSSAVEIYDKLCSMVKTSEDENNRGSNTRSEYLVGYYGGALVETTATTDYRLNQKVEVVNDEELYIKISYDYTGRMLKYQEADFEIEVTITGEESGKSWNKQINKDMLLKNDYVNLTDRRLEVGLLLDGLRAGQNFSAITSGEGLIPGEDLLVDVETTFKQGGVTLKERTKTAEKVNSLFESVENQSGVHTIAFSKVRHLRNLGEEYYTHTAPGSVLIAQDADIDFKAGKYAFNEKGEYVGAGEASRPIFAIEPIVNEALFNNTEDSRTVTVKGNKIVDGDNINFIIKNLVVSPAEDSLENIGLFAVAAKVNFEYVKLEDFTVNAPGCSNVGALVGSVSGGKIDHSGVYLAPFYTDENGTKRYYNQEIDSEYGTVMASRYESCGVTGESNVGGLVGKATGTEMTHSFAAVQVKGNSYVGGFVGNGNNQTISNCYASGDVRHLNESGSRIGGFLGYAYHVKASDVYASGNIYGADVIGGLIGETDYGDYTNCSSYGKVLNIKGTDYFAESVSVGGLICMSYSSENRDDKGSCHYLRQLGYNTSSKFEDSVLAYSYGDFKDASAGNMLATGASYPYDGTLLYKAFPFKKATDHHYGNWPLQYLINTSLVYYEKYENGTYGYYSVTTLTDTSDSGEVQTDDYVWVLDSLQDKECIEDGYALLSMYYLEKFDYVSYQYKGGTDDTNSSWSKDAEGTLEVVSKYMDGNTSDYAVLLRQQGFLEFRAYDKIDGVDEYTVDYTGRSVQDSFTTSGMYLYQLPYDLQCTDRYAVYNFYDRFIVYNAYAKGNDVAPVIGGTTAAEGETFYYSPHFAKTAVNPGLGVANNATLANPEYVHVRSARQLNALGRVPYYWNKEGGASKMTFIQDVDINFGTYTQGTKKYCGVNYDLMDTSDSNPVANKPIGQPDLAGTYKQFRNIYDGNYKQIIDYNQSSNSQFSGLFGEVRDATLKNIFMTVSKPGAGKIASSYQTDTINTTRRAGVGALVGLAYLEKNVIENCAAAGYTVEYKIVPTRSGCLQPRGIAVGGLFGLCMSSISNCTATNDVLLTVTANYDDTNGLNKAVFLGGLAGSYYYGTMTNAYSGGTIDINMTGDYKISRMRIGGLCPGFMYTARDDEGEVDSVEYKNFYTYTQVTTDIWNTDFNDNLDKGGTFDHFIPSVGRMSWNRDGNGNTRCLDEVSVPGGYGAFYLQEAFEARHIDMIPDNSDVWDYFTEHDCDDNRVLGIFPKSLGKTDNAITYADLSDVENLKSKWSLTNDDMSHRATETYSYDVKKLADQEYPFPAFNYKIVNGEKVYLHFGDWPLEEDFQ